MAIQQKFPVTKASAVNTEEGLTVQDIVTELIIAPTFTSPSATANTASASEVGTSIEIKAKFTPGDSGGINTGGTFGNVSIGGTAYAKSSVSNNIITYSPTYKVPLNSTTITYGAIPYNAGTGSKKYKVNNKEVEKTMANPIEAGSVTPAQQTIYGYYRWFAGWTTSQITDFTNMSATIRSLNKSTLVNSLSLTTDKVPADNTIKGLLIAVPTGYALVSAVYNSDIKQDWADKFVTKSINVNDAGGTSRSYTLYYYEEDFNGGSTLTITIKKS